MLNAIGLAHLIKHLTNRIRRSRDLIFFDLWVINYDSFSIVNLMIKLKFQNSFFFLIFRNKVWTEPDINHCLIQSWNEKVQITSVISRNTFTAWENISKWSQKSPTKIAFVLFANKNVLFVDGLVRGLREIQAISPILIAFDNQQVNSDQSGANYAFYLKLPLIGTNWPGNYRKQLVWDFPKG